MILTPFDIVLRLILGLVIGFCIGLTGIGGGVLVMPALTLALGLSPAEAVGTASLYAFITKTAASHSHNRLGNVNWRATRLVLAGGVPGCILVAYAVNATLARFGKMDKVEEAAAFQAGLGLLLASVVLLAALIMIHQVVKHNGKGGDVSVPDETQPVAQTPAQIAFASVSGVFVGALIGATSVGGGVILVPLLGMLKLTPRQTVGTSVVIALALTLVTSVIYGGGAQLAWSTGLIMGVVALLGARLGAKSTNKVPQDTMRWMLAGIVVFSALLMLWKQFSGAGMGGH